jgi:hypothetical protein
LRKASHEPIKSTLDLIPPRSTFGEVHQLVGGRAGGVIRIAESVPGEIDSNTFFVFEYHYRRRQKAKAGGGKKPN